MNNKWPARKFRRPAFLIVLIGIVAGLLPPLVMAPAYGATFTVKASADSYVRSDTPDVNYGTKFVVSMSAASASTPNSIGYVKFDVKGLSAPPAHVGLRLYSYAQSGPGIQVSTTASSWTETGITFSNAPGIDRAVGSIPNLTVNAWFELDVTSAVTGNGTYTFAITTTTTSTKQVSSREAAATTPQLVVDPAAPVTPPPSDTAPPTAAPTPTATATATPTPTATPIASATPTLTATPTDSATAADTSTPTPTSSGAVTPTVTATPTDGVTPTVTATPTDAPTPTPSDSATPSATPSSADTPTPTPTVIDTPTATATTEAPTIGPTASDTPTATPTVSQTPSAAPTATDSPSGTPSPTVTATTPPVTTTFVGAADATVRSDQPDVNSGTAYTLFAQAPSASGPEQRSYLKFNVQGLSGTVVSAVLQVYSFSNSADGLDVATAGNGWTETGVTWANSPAAGPVVVSIRPLPLNAWASADVTAAVAGSGTYTFVLSTVRTSANKVSSREATTNRPTLVVTTSQSPTPTPTPSATPTAIPSVSATSTLSNDPTIVTAGDIGCPQNKVPTTTSCQQMATSDLAVSLQPTAVLPLGDNQYELGGIDDFTAMYDPSWGRLKSISYPVAGNHEWGYIGTAIEPTQGAGYFQYFGARSHPSDPACTAACTSWYSYDIGAWHIVALDSQCGAVGGCNAGNRQYQWLQSDLNSHPNRCTLAYWHIPLYSSSQDHQPDMQNIYKLLYDKGADVVLTGHAHFYERFGLQDSAGNADPARGIRQFLVGTGGRSFFAVRATPAANSEMRIANTFGVLKMTLHDTGYDWRFVPVAGSTATDSGSGTCH